MPATRGRHESIEAPLPAVRLALLELVETDAEHAGDELQRASGLPSLPGRTSAAIGSAGSVGRAAPSGRAEDSAGGKHSSSAVAGSPTRRARRRRSGRKCGARAEALERQDLLVDPARARRGRGADRRSGTPIAQRARQRCRRGSSRSAARRDRETPARAARAPGRTPSPADQATAARGRSRARCAASAPTLVAVAVADECAVFAIG